MITLPSRLQSTPWAASSDQSDSVRPRTNPDDRELQSFHTAEARVAILVPHYEVGRIVVGRQTEELAQKAEPAKRVAVSNYDCDDVLRELLVHAGGQVGRRLASVPIRGALHRLDRADVAGRRRPNHHVDEN